MRKSEITSEIQEQVLESYKEIGTIRWVQKELWEALWLTFHNIRDIVAGINQEITEQKNDIQQLNEAIKSQKTYEVTDDHYIFYLSEEDNYWNKTTKPYPIAISTVDAIFRAYSKHWENKTGEQVLQEFKIKPEVWNVIKRRLRLYKDSHILSPVSLERFEWREEEMESFINGAVEEHIQDKYIKKFQKSWRDSFDKEAKKAMKRMAEIDNFLDYLKKYIDNYEPRNIDFEYKQPTNNDSVDISISDLHIWKQDTDLVLKRLESIYNDLVKRPEWIINIFCLWDLAEILVEWGRHPWQTEWMDWPYWFDLFMKVVSDLENFLLNIYKAGKQVNFVWLAGNHWTLSDKKSGDLEFTWELLIYELIKRWLQNTKINIEYLRWMWHGYPTDNFHYILNHWYANHTSKKAKDLLWEFWNNTQHNILLQWDKHHTNITDVAENATRIITPSLCGRGSYDTQLWISSYPWYVLIEKNEDGLPNTIVRRLK